MKNFYLTLDEVLKTHYDIIDMSGGLFVNGYKCASKYTVRMEKEVVNVATDSISKDELSTILSELIS